jgi:hypothetical protein
MAAIRADGRFKVIQDIGENHSTVGSETVGWMLGDEPDMSDNQADGCPSWFSSHAAPADGRWTYANFGKGLAQPPGNPDPTRPWRGDGTNGNWYSSAAEQSCFANGVDLASEDMYWWTDPWQGVFCCGSNYGDNITNLRNADAMNGSRHPNWGLVETGDPWQPTEPTPAVSITPAQMRSAVWHQVVAGARGLVWFEHSFRGPCGTEHHNLRTNCEGTRAMAGSVDAQLANLAGVLSSPSVTSDQSVSGPVRRLVKWDGSHFYVFMAATGGGTGTFSMPCVGDATATNLGESTGALSIPVSGGSFSDTFADRNAVHIYRIDGGSRCGL